MARSRNRKPTNDPQPAASLDIEEPSIEEPDAEETPAAEATPAEQPPVAPSEPRARQGDQNRPLCPNCSTPDKPVLMVAVRSEALFTRYACPNRFSQANPEGECTHPVVKHPRPEQQQFMARHRNRQAQPRIDDR